MKTIILGTAHLKSTPGKCSPDKRLKEYEYSDTALQYIVMHKVENILYDKDNAVSEYTVTAKRIY